MSNKTIYKYELEIEDYQELSLPVGYKILTVQVQHEVPCIWVLIDQDELIKKTVVLRMVGTGHIIQDEDVSGQSYIGTFQLFNGDLIYHVFKIR